MPFSLARAFSCFPAKASDDKQCIFCNVTREQFDIVKETETLLVFNDRSPGARVHMLVIPRMHVDNISTLDQSHVPMLEEAVALGKEVLAARQIPLNQSRMGFHIAPFHSIDHLHLHVLGFPFTTMGKYKYRMSPSTDRRIKGFSHFVTADQAIRILSEGKQVLVKGN